MNNKSLTRDYKLQNMNTITISAKILAFVRDAVGFPCHGDVVKCLIFGCLDIKYFIRPSYSWEYVRDFNFNFKRNHGELIICVADMFLVFLSVVRNIRAQSSVHSSMYFQVTFSITVSTPTIGSLVKFLRRFLETLFSSCDYT